MKKKKINLEFIMHLVGNKPIRRQLFGVYSITMVLPILVLGLFLMWNTYRLLSSSQSDLMQSDNSSVRNLVYAFTTQVRNLSETVLFDDSIQAVLSGEFESPEDFRRKVDRIELLDSYRKNYVLISDIEVYCDNPDVVDYKQFQVATEAISSSDWYQKALQSPGVFWTGLTKKNTAGAPNHYLCLVRQIPILNSEYHAVLVMRIGADYLRSSVENGFYDIYMAVGREGTFYTTNRSLTGSGMPMEIDYGQTYYQSYGKIVQNGRVCYAQVTALNPYQTDSKIYICTVNKDGYYDIWHIIIICAVILLVSILIPGILISVFTYYLTGRIGLLRNEMHKASRQDYELIPVLYGKDEIAEAHADLQIMVENIKEHEAKVYEAKIMEQELESKQREMEYKMLASQINPHFLYNTLETIRMKAFTAGDREVAGAIKLLGKSMRYVLENTGTSKTTLAKELEHVEVYLSIQQLRFGDRFDYQLDNQENIDTEKISMLPLMLQPIVENAVVHGLEALDENGHISIRIYKTTSDNQTDCIAIEVSDNGNGMDQETLEQLRIDVKTRDVSKNKSIGLYNINQRMKLLYGEDYSLQVDSREGVGTRVVMLLPIRLCYEE